MESGLKKYRLIIREINNSITYEIWPQNLGYSLPGVKYTTRPDFVFKCVALSIDGVSQSFDHVQQVKDIIVYLDGYQFHASLENPRVFSDLKIRDAIHQSNRYHQWIFSWEDIISHAASKSEDSLYRKLNLEEVEKISGKHPALKSFDLSSVKKLNSFNRFTVLLKSPLLDINLKLWASIQLFACQSKLLVKCIANDQVDAFLDSGKVKDFTFEPSKPQQFALCDAFEFRDELKIICLGQPTTLEIKAAIFHRLPESDYEKGNWELFWQVYNLLQFSSYLGVEREHSEESKTEKLTTILENFRPELHRIVTSLIAQKVEINTEFDFDLLEGEVIVALAELGSASHKFFMYPFDEESRLKFVENEYQEYTIET
ncbi:MAG: hypothetical protein RIF39_08710, partial [Cyclobacteriaceae bacterium]